jgi:4-hydroxy-tetrahydrodipicolinate reductase
VEKWGAPSCAPSPNAEGAVLAAAIERSDYPYLAADASQLAGLSPASGVRVVDQRPAKGAADVWIDFSTPSAAVPNAQAAAAAGAAIVIGTTGVSAADKEKIAAIAKTIPIVLTPNMSMGVNVMLKLVADAARMLGPGYDIEIVETHHRAKRDAPSGTALRLGEAVAEARGAIWRPRRALNVTATSVPRTQSEIGMQTLRGGDVFGDHTVFFFGQGDRIEITHRASSRDTFAHGAVRAALWLAGKAGRTFRHARRARTKVVRSEQPWNHRTKTPWIKRPSRRSLPGDAENPRAAMLDTYPAEEVVRLFSTRKARPSRPPRRAPPEIAQASRLLGRTPGRR